MLNPLPQGQMGHNRPLKIKRKGVVQIKPRLSRVKTQLRLPKQLWTNRPQSLPTSQHQKLAQIKLQLPLPKQLWQNRLPSLTNSQPPRLDIAKTQPQLPKQLGLNRVHHLLNRHLFHPLPRPSREWKRNRHLRLHSPLPILNRKWR